MVENLDDAREANRAAGLHFFDPGASMFFRSRYVGDLIRTPAGAFFITSEQFDRFSPRKYSVREFNDETSSVRTVGKFMGYDTPAAARHAIPREATA